MKVEDSFFFLILQPNIVLFSEFLLFVHKIMHVYYKLLWRGGGINKLCIESLIVTQSKKEDINHFTMASVPAILISDVSQKNFVQCILLQVSWILFWIPGTCNTHLLYMYLESQCVEIWKIKFFILFFRRIFWPQMICL